MLLPICHGRLSPRTRAGVPSLSAAAGYSNCCSNEQLGDANTLHCDWLFELNSHSASSSMSSLLLRTSRCAFKVSIRRRYDTRYFAFTPILTRAFGCASKSHAGRAYLVERPLWRSSSAPTAQLQHFCNFFTSASSPLGLESSSSAGPNVTELPPLSGPAVTKWLFLSASLVFGIVVVGGITRLTESGLSIVEWRPITGVLPPLAQQEWEEEFDKYKTSPEFKM